MYNTCVQWVTELYPIIHLLTGAAGFSSSSQSYNDRYNPIVLGNMNCEGTEERLLNCDYTRSSISICGNTQDAAVRCSIG